MTRLITFAPVLKRWGTTVRNPEPEVNRPEVNHTVVQGILSIVLSSSHAHAFTYKR